MVGAPAATKSASMPTAGAAEPPIRADQGKAHEALAAGYRAFKFSLASGRVAA